MMATYPFTNEIIEKHRGHKDFFLVNYKFGYLELFSLTNTFHLVSIRTIDLSVSNIFPNLKVDLQNSTKFYKILQNLN